MSLTIFPVISILAISLALAILYATKYMALGAVSAIASASRTGRYQPMLRLLSHDDFAVVGGNKRLLKRLRAERSIIFRGYVRCLALDYGRLLAGLKMAALHSSVDRPDLAWVLLQNRIVFAGLLCRLDILLTVHRMGLRQVDVSGALSSLEALRAQTSAALLAPMALAA